MNKSVKNRYGYHISPLHGWSNDPNGLCYFKDKYHVFFQYNPYKLSDSTVQWGHVTSGDLIHWYREIPALVPDHEYDQDGCFSGSAYIDNNELKVIYTGHKNISNHKYQETQCLAISHNGIDFHKFTNNPIIDTPPINNTHRFRDPKIWKNGKYYYLVIGGESESLKGQINIYKSEKIVGPWKHIKTLGSHTYYGNMWECPDLFKIKENYILLFSPKGLVNCHKNFNTVYTILDNKNNINKLSILDNGLDFYAATTFLDYLNNRRILLGWFGLPGEQEKEINKYNQVGALTIPRIVDYKKGKLYMKPIPEIKKLRIPNGEYKLENNIKITNCAELDIPIQDNYFLLKLISHDSHFIIEYRNKKLKVSIWDDLRSHINTIRIEKINNLQLFIDKGLTELFVNDGESVFTNKCELKHDIKIICSKNIFGKVFLLEDNAIQ